jgi:hypothetical protein
MVVTDSNSIFPDQVVPDEVKSSYDYGMQVGKAIEGEWFSGTRTGMGNRYSTNFNNFRNLRLYARGEQAVQKYKDELAINGDLSYLNLDWKPVPVIPKFVDIVVNGMSEKLYEIKAYAQDPESLKARTEYANKILRDIEEELINNTLDRNRYELTRRRVNEDLVILGIGCSKTSFNKAEGITVDYVDPARLVYSYTEDPNFEDIWYVGEVKRISLSDLKMQYPDLTPDELERIEKYPGNSDYIYNFQGRDDNNSVYVLYFEYKTYSDQVFKIKETANGLEKALEKPDTFNPPKNDNFNRVSRSIEVLYSGAKILGHEMLLEWELAKNMTRPTSNLVKVNMNYNICAPRMYKGRIESLVSRVTGFADMIQLTHLKLQQVMSRVVPDGVFLDADGLAEVDLGNGTSYNPQEALNMYFQTGSIIGRSMTQDGGANPGKVPIQELSSSNGMGKIQGLIQTYEYYLKMIRDVTGLNEARDGSTPSSDSLVGLQKLAIANSNTATRHVVQASLYLTLRTCENIALRVGDCLEFDLTREALKASISSYNVGTLEDIYSLQLYDFGVFLELVPDEEEKAQLEQNIQVALQGGQIYLEDAIDIRQVNNLKLANQLLKQRRKQKQKQDQEAQQANIAAQGQAQAETAERTAMAEVQKQEALAQTTLSIEQGKSQFEIQRMEREAEIKRQLMQIEFDFNIQLTKAKGEAERNKETFIEDRKDKRAKLIGTQQSQMIDQKKNDLLPTNFESAGNDNLGGFGLEQFAPQ